MAGDSGTPAEDPIVDPIVIVSEDAAAHLKSLRSQIFSQFGLPLGVLGLIPAVRAVWRLFVGDPGGLWALAAAVGLGLLVFLGVPWVLRLRTPVAERRSRLTFDAERIMAETNKVRLELPWDHIRAVRANRTFIRLVTHSGSLYLPRTDLTDGDVATLQAWCARHPTVKPAFPNALLVALMVVVFTVFFFAFQR